MTFLFCPNRSLNTVAEFPAVYRAFFSLLGTVVFELLRHSLRENKYTLARVLTQCVRVCALVLRAVVVVVCCQKQKLQGELQGEEGKGWEDRHASV